MNSEPSVAGETSGLRMMRGRSRLSSLKLACISLCVPIAIVGCSSSDDLPPESKSLTFDSSVPLTKGTLPFDSVLRWRGELELEERADALNVAPIPDMASPDEILVADAREGQVRVYGPSGELRGAYPKELVTADREFWMPVALLRMPDSTLVVVDRVAGLFRLNAAADSVVAHVALELGQVEQALRLGGEKLALFTRPRPSKVIRRFPYIGRFVEARIDDLVYVVDAASGAVSSSFFKPAVDGTGWLAAQWSGWSGGRARGDTLAVFYAMSDTVYLVGADGSLYDKVPLATHNFRVPGPIATSELAEKETRYAWLASSSRFSNLFWTAAGDFVVEYIDMYSPSQAHRRLLIMSRDGNRVAEVAEAPQLLWVADDGRYYFSNVDGGEQWVWRYASH